MKLEHLCLTYGRPPQYGRLVLDSVCTGPPIDYSNLSPFHIVLISAYAFLEQTARIGAAESLWICSKLKQDQRVSGWAHAAENHRQEVLAGKVSSPLPGHQLVVADGKYVSWTGHELCYVLPTLTEIRHAPPPIYLTQFFIENCYFKLHAQVRKLEQSEQSAEQSAIASVSTGQE